MWQHRACSGTVVTCLVLAIAPGSVSAQRTRTTPKLTMTAAGTTSGQSTTETIDLGYGGKVLAPMVSAGSSVARVSAGPALLLANWSYFSPDGNSERVQTTSVGWVGAATVRMPIVARFYVEGTAQYRGFTSPTVRPSQPGRPCGSARVSHSYLGLGIGLMLP